MLGLVFFLKSSDIKMQFFWFLAPSLKAQVYGRWIILLNNVIELIIVIILSIIDLFL